MVLGLQEPVDSDGVVTSLQMPWLWVWKFKGVRRLVLLLKWLRKDGLRRGGMRN